MKKILILVMSCNDEFFKQQVEKIKQTWAKPILDGKYSNIDFMSYDGWDGQHYYDKDNKCIHIRCEDDLDNTYKKTFYALSIIKHKLSNLYFDDVIAASHPCPSSISPSPNKQYTL